MAENGRQVGKVSRAPGHASMETRIIGPSANEVLAIVTASRIHLIIIISSDRTVYCVVMCIPQSAGVVVIIVDNK